MKKPLILDDSQRSVLSQWVRLRTVSIRWRARARIILAAANGGTDQAIADTLDTTRHRVARWRARFIEGGGLCADGSYHKTLDVAVSDKLARGERAASAILERAGAGGIIQGADLFRRCPRYAGRRQRCRRET